MLGGVEMSFFYQKIAYLGYYEEDQRIKNIGFVKIRADDTMCKVEIQINGLFSTDTFVCDMYCGETNDKLDELSVKKGKACYAQTFPIEKIGKSKISFQEFKSIRIQFPGGKRAIAVWEKEKEMQAAQIPEKVYSSEREYTVNPFMMRNKQKIEPNKMKAREDDQVRVEEYNQTRAEAVTYVGAADFNQVKAEGFNQTREEGFNQVKAEDFFRQARQEENDKAKKEELKKEELNNVQTEKWKNHSFEPKSTNKGNENTIPMPHTYHNKWQQLKQLYPNIMPFENQQEGEYLSITPNDFVILNETHQHLVNNSFLLHGYYNYRHLLLGKRVEREKEIYYIGVPGNFYKREKMVAVMFGFEAFEPTIQEEEEVTQGTFGYYLKEVTI